MRTVLAFLMFFTLTDVVDNVAAAIRSGNAKEVSKYFAEKVDMKVIDQENIYSKAQAELILKDFFAKHPVKSFTLAPKSEGRHGLRFAIGTLTTANGTYRVHFVMKTSDSGAPIQQFRIEPSDE